MNFKLSTAGSPRSGTGPRPRGRPPFALRLALVVAAAALFRADARLPNQNRAPAPDCAAVGVVDEETCWDLCRGRDVSGFLQDILTDWGGHWVAVPNAGGGARDRLGGTTYLCRCSAGHAEPYGCVSSFGAPTQSPVPTDSPSEVPSAPPRRAASGVPSDVPTVVSSFSNRRDSLPLVLLRLRSLVIGNSHMFFLVGADKRTVHGYFVNPVGRP
jgi:hypothetical protein